jgi:cell division protein FtsL
MLQDLSKQLEKYATLQELEELKREVEDSQNQITNNTKEINKLKSLQD